MKKNILLFITIAACTFTTIKIIDLSSNVGNKNKDWAYMNYSYSTPNQSSSGTSAFINLEKTEQQRNTANHRYATSEQNTGNTTISNGRGWMASQTSGYQSSTRSYADIHNIRKVRRNKPSDFTNAFYSYSSRSKKELYGIVNNPNTQEKSVAITNRAMRASNDLPAAEGNPVILNNNDLPPGEGDPPILNNGDLPPAEGDPPILNNDDLPPPEGMPIGNATVFTIILAAGYALLKKRRI